MSRILSVRNRHASGLSAALEELAQEPVAAAVTEEVVSVEAFDDEAMQTQADLDQAANDVEEAHEVVSELEEGAAGLEAIAVALESTLADGGLTPQAAIFMNQAVNSHTKRLGMRRSIVPALESFGGQSSRLQATNIALESVGDTLKKIWEAIKNACIAAWNSVLAFFDRLFNVAPRIKHKAEAMLKQVEELKGDAKGEIDIGSVYGKISIDGSAKVPSEVVTLFDSAIELAKHVEDEAGKAAVSEALKAASDKDVELEKSATKKVCEAAMAAAKAIGSFRKEKKADDGSVEFETETLPGDEVFVLHYGLPKEGDDLKQALGRLSDVRLTRKHVGKEAQKEEKKIVPLSKDTMKSYLEDIIKLADKAIDAKKHIGEVVAAGKKELEGVKAEFATADERSQGIAAAAIRSKGKRLANAARMPYDIYRYGADVMSSYLTVVAKSMKAYGAKVEEEKKEEEKK